MADDALRPVCGLVMPISLIDGLNEAHWLEVRAILSEAIVSGGFEPQLVSQADDIGIIQKRIIQNLYDNPIVVIDVSAKNPNVMFELGIRLAFDKPTIIVKDDKTSYSFDTAPIEHLTYPRDLRFQQIIDFKSQLVIKLKATYQKATTDRTYTTFLKHFGEFTVAKLDNSEVTGQEFILKELSELKEMATLSLRRQLGPEGRGAPLRPDAFFDGLDKLPPGQQATLPSKLQAYGATIVHKDSDTLYFRLDTVPLNFRKSRLTEIQNEYPQLKLYDLLS